MRQRQGLGATDADARRVDGKRLEVFAGDGPTLALELGGRAQLRIVDAFFVAPAVGREGIAGAVDAGQIALDLADRAAGHHSLSAAAGLVEAGHDIASAGPAEGGTGNAAVMAVAERDDAGIAVADEMRIVRTGTAPEICVDLLPGERALTLIDLEPHAVDRHVAAIGARPGERLIERHDGRIGDLIGLAGAAVAAAENLVAIAVVACSASVV